MTTIRPGGNFGPYDMDRNNNKTVSLSEGGNFEQRGPRNPACGPFYVKTMAMEPYDTDRNDNKTERQF